MLLSLKLRQKKLQKSMTQNKTNEHVSVFLHELVSLLPVVSDGWYIDATLGSGGHTREILSQGGKVVAFDWDDEAIGRASDQFSAEIKAQRLFLLHEPFSQLKAAVKSLEKQDVPSYFSGVIFDFGTSTEQLMSEERGFSFRGNGVLDMRMDVRLAVMAKDIIGAVPAKQLAQLFRDFGGELEADRIAKAIKSSPEPIVTTKQLADLVISVKHKKAGSLHPATKVFQALRIAVNSELTEIQLALPQALSLLSSGSKLLCVSFHEGEDRLAKHYFQIWEEQEKGARLSKKPMMPSEEELDSNPRSRSAKLRGFVKK